METSYGPIIRIVLRVLAGILIGKSIFGSNTDTILNTIIEDPTFLSAIEFLVSATVLYLTERWYVLAKKWGWAT